MKHLTKMLGLFFILASCGTGSDGKTYYGIEGSAAWRKTASKADIKQYYGNICESYGYSWNTAKMTDCIADEIRAARKQYSDSVNSDSW